MMVAWDGIDMANVAFFRFLVGGLAVLLVGGVWSDFDPCPLVETSIIFTVVFQSCASNLG